MSLDLVGPFFTPTYWKVSFVLIKHLGFLIFFKAAILSRI